MSDKKQNFMSSIIFDYINVFIFLVSMEWRHDYHHNDTRNNAAQYHEINHDVAQYNAININDSQNYADSAD